MNFHVKFAENLRPEYSDSFSAMMLEDTMEINQGNTRKIQSLYSTENHGNTRKSSALFRPNFQPKPETTENVLVFLLACFPAYNNFFPPFPWFSVDYAGKRRNILVIKN
jgi:hypothetical protein